MDIVSLPWRRTPTCRREVIGGSDGYQHLIPYLSRLDYEGHRESWVWATTAKTRHFLSLSWRLAVGTAMYAYQMFSVF